jgi:hypothetical protein
MLLISSKVPEILLNSQFTHCFCSFYVKFLNSLVGWKCIMKIKWVLLLLFVSSNKLNRKFQCKLLQFFRYSVGDTNVPFCLQSVSKPLTYAMVLDDLSPEVIHEYVGHEPSGVAFNTINLDYRGKWAAPWQNQHNAYDTNMDPDQPHPRSLIRIHAVRLQTLLQVGKLIANSMDPDQTVHQTVRMRRLVWIHAGRKHIMLVLLWRS